MFNIISRNRLQDNSLLASIIHLLFSFEPTINILVLLPQIPLVEADQFLSSRDSVRLQLKKLLRSYFTRAVEPSHCFTLNGHLLSTQLVVKTIRSLLSTRIAEFQHGWVNGKNLFSSDVSFLPHDFLATDLSSSQYVRSTYPGLNTYVVGQFGLYINHSIRPPELYPDKTLSILLSQSKRDIELGYQSADTINTPWSSYPIPIDVYPFLKDLSSCFSLSISIRLKPHTSYKSAFNKSTQPLYLDLLNSDLVLSPVSTLNIQAQAIGISSAWFSPLLTPTSKALFDAYPSIPKLNCTHNSLSDLLEYRVFISKFLNTLSSSSPQARFKSLIDMSITIRERMSDYLRFSRS